MGYEWHPTMHQVSLNGTDTLIDLRTAFSDAGGPVGVALDYDQIKESRDDINRQNRDVNFGFRPHVVLTFDIATMADQATLATIVSRLVDSGWESLLSLDNGVTERLVRLVKSPSPRPLKGKTFAGARFELEMECVSLIPELPAIGSGSW